MTKEKLIMTYNDLIKVQEKQLAQWAAVLKPEVHSALVATIKSITPTAKSLSILPDLDVAPALILDSIPRGTTIDEIVGNWILNPSTLPV